MDFIRKGRTWTGKIHDKFESIFQEVDDFVGKDSVKYLENQVQIVGETVKKVYANVLHDFVPPMVYNKQGKSCADKKHDNATSAVGGIIHRHVFPSDSRSCQLEDGAGHLHCNDHQKHFNPSTSAEFPEKPNNVLNPKDAEKTVAKGKHSIYRDLDRGDNPPSFTDRDKHPSVVTSDSIERSSAEHLFTVTSESLERKSVIGSTDISDVEGCMSNIVTKLSTENLVEVVELESNQNCKTITNSEVLPEGEETTLSLNPFIPFLKTSEIDAPTNASDEDILVSDAKCLFEEKDYSGLAFHFKEQQLLTANLCVVQDENLLCTGLRLVHIDETMCNNSESDKVEGKDDETVAAECTSHVKYENPCAVYMGDKHLIAEASNSLENKAFDHGNDIHPDAFIDFELVPEFQEEEKEKSISDGFEQVESDLSTVKELGDESYSNSTVEENHKSELGAEVYESFSKYECSSDLASAGTCESSNRVCLDESIADNFKHFYGYTKLKANTSASDSGCEDDSAVVIDDSNMENVDLTDKEKAEEASFVVEEWLVHTASYRSRRVKSYKRMVLDALGSRKRVIKEYEQLAILCGEIDDGVTSAALPLPTCDSCELSWELV